MRAQLAVASWPDKIPDNLTILFFPLHLNRHKYYIATMSLPTQQSCSSLWRLNTIIHTYDAFIKTPPVPGRIAPSMPVSIIPATTSPFRIQLYKRINTHNRNTRLDCTLQLLHFTHTRL